MAAQLLNEFKREISAFTLFPSDGGRFEIEVDGDLVYSKLATGSFPDERQVVSDIRSR